MLVMLGEGLGELMFIMGLGLGLWCWLLVRRPSSLPGLSSLPGFSFSGLGLGLGLGDDMLVMLGDGLGDDMFIMGLGLGEVTLVMLGEGLGEVMLTMGLGEGFLQHKHQIGQRSVHLATCRKRWYTNSLRTVMQLKCAGLCVLCHRTHGACIVSW
jgi:hypothetical protein